MSAEIFKKTLIIGLGLIGGSFAKALRHNQISSEIYACDLDPDSLEQAIKSSVIDDFVMLDDDLKSFDFIVLATPLSTYETIAKKLRDQAAPNAVIIDLGSVKNLTIKKKLGENFIPCHPIAGSEKTGFANSDAELFHDKKFIICPENCNQTSVKKIAQIAEQIGSKTEFLDSKKHDEIYALVSHLPQFLSFLTADFSPKKITGEFFTKSFRLNDSDPKIWSDIFKLNEKNLEKFYLKFFDNIEKNIANLLRTKTESLEIDNSLTQEEQKFLEENFAAVLFRALVVQAYLEISEIQNFQNYGGSGFRDFTAVVRIFNSNHKKLAELTKQHHPQILKLFQKLT